MEEVVAPVGCRIPSLGGDSFDHLVAMAKWTIEVDVFCHSKLVNALHHLREGALDTRVSYLLVQGLYYIDAARSGNAQPA